MNKPENNYYNACILRDFQCFAKGGFNLLNENCDINPAFYDLIEADAYGNIIKVNNQPVTRNGTIYFL